MNDSLEKAIKIIVQVAEPDKIILFGSHARGDDKPLSDYDLLVLKGGVRKKRNLVSPSFLDKQFYLFRTYYFFSVSNWFYNYFGCIKCIFEFPT